MQKDTELNAFLDSLSRETLSFCAVLVSALAGKPLDVPVSDTAVLEAWALIVHKAAQDPESAGRWRDALNCMERFYSVSEKYGLSV